MVKSPSNTAAKQGRKKSKPPIGKRFKKNDPETGERDERINRMGRPRVADELKQFIQNILHEEGSITNPLTLQVTKITVLRQMVLKMAVDGTPADRIHLLDRGFGKVADEIVFSNDDLKRIIDYLPPDMLDRIVKGESLGDVLISWITTHRDGETSADQKDE